MCKLLRWLPLVALFISGFASAEEASPAPLPTIAEVPAEATSTGREEAAALSLEAIDLAADGDSATADALMAQAHSLTPEDPLLYARHAVVDLYLARPQAALEKLDALLESGYEPASLHLNRSLALRALGRYEAARDAFIAYREALGSALVEEPVTAPPRAPDDLLRPGP